MEVLFHLAPPDNKLFDVKQMKDELLSSSVTFFLPHDSEITIIVCASPSMRDYIRDSFTRDSNFRSVTQGFITLREHYITVGQSSPEEILKHMKALIIPIIERYNCRIFNEYSQDISAKYRGNLDALF
jgi:hypothetical protein